MVILVRAEYSARRCCCAGSGSFDCACINLLTQRHYKSRYKTCAPFLLDSSRISITDQTVPEAMSVIGEAAAIIGITDVAVKSIKGLYEFLRAINDAPGDIVLIRVDVQGLQAKLSDLEFLSKADARTVDEIKETGIAEVINDCGTQCDELEKLVGKWIKHDEKSWRDKVRVALNQSRIQKYKAVLWSAARELDSAVNILNL